MANKQGHYLLENYLREELQSIRDIESEPEKPENPENPKLPEPSEHSRRDCSPAPRPWHIRYY